MDFTMHHARHTHRMNHLNELYTIKTKNRSSNSRNYQIGPNQVGTLWAWKSKNGIAKIGAIARSLRRFLAAISVW